MSNCSENLSFFGAPVIANMLHVDELHESQKRVQQCMQEDNNTSDFITHLLRLAEANLVAGASRHFRTLHRPEHSTNELNAEDTSRFVSTVCVEFHRQLRLFYKLEQMTLFCVGMETIDQWRLNPVRIVTVDDLVERCGDQISAALIFRNLHVVGADCDLLWTALFARAICKVIFSGNAHSKVSTKASPVLRTRCTKENIVECVSIILAKKTYEYRTLGAAIKYFRDLWLYECLERWERDKEKREEMANAFTSAPSVDAKRSDQRSFSFDEISEALANRSMAIKLWILVRVFDRMAVEKTDYDTASESLIGWKAVGYMIPEPRCRILEDDDLPPDVSWQDVEKAFDKSALNEDAIKNFVSRTRKRVRTYVDALSS